MVQFTAILAASMAISAASALPFQKRIAQTIADSTKDWVAACTKAGGADKCGTISQTAFTTLLAAGKNCDQQDAADQMVDLAKTLNNDPDMIKFAQLFVQQPRNAPDSLQVPYCQTAPKNAELNGFFHCQFSGSDFTKFSGDQTGNKPLGVDNLDPAGSCPASKTPIPDGKQLTDITQDPGQPQGASGSAASGSSNSTASATSAAPAASSSVASTASGSDNSGAGAASESAATTAAPAASSSPAAAAGAASGFQAQNGKDAQALNAKFATLTADSACTDGDQACVSGGFAQCVGGKFVTTQCAGGTQCFALPLVNKAGTSVTCSTQADAAARIAATGTQGGVTGSG
ncbi:hypothetical protein PLICRDRAFT_57463 [Plicaturopsis crispa FD-325 SS-3]|uniref:Carbohydrate-binding module family 19 domain-containing protein n=1 Tax=Plicaturopsis crispa FD-325 SS-3 TaxID=944288 RepID=A0A0C9T9M7_PLICR|nr:hypothetical protein PLICRDRAFT_57463 [Plicaturopsis crispa FD-325 SS-3]